MRSFGRMAAALAVLAALAPGLGAQSNVAALYEEALAREAPLRAEIEALPPGRSDASLHQRIRVLIDAYRDLARLFPTSGYSDNALWQGGTLAGDLYRRFGDEADRTAAIEMLTAVAARFPTSSLVKRVPTEVARLEGAAARASAEPAPQRRAGPASSTVLLQGIRRELFPDVLRVTLDLEREVAFRDEALDGPPRVYIDLQNTKAAEALKDATLPFGDDVVKQVRVGRQLDVRTRVVFDLHDATGYSVYALYNPYRIVFDFERERVAPAAPSTNSTGGFSLSRQLGLGVGRIVIDPGHGGHDPGAKIPGLTEATLVLDVALRLERLLKAEEVEVVLTRRSNTYVPLEERTARANSSGADLFLSIHANASDASSVQGVETYFLDLAPDPAAAAIAARENAGSAKSMHHLPGILEAIALNNKLDESRDFAAMVHERLYARLRPANPRLRDLGVKQAPFVVLVGARMPAILAEIAFMTNPQDAALLKTEQYRQEIAAGLFDGLMRYQTSLKTSSALAATP